MKINGVSAIVITDDTTILKMVSIRVMRKQHRKKRKKRHHLITIRGCIHG